MELCSITLHDNNTAWLTIQVNPAEGQVNLPTGGIVMRDGMMIEYDETQVSPGLSCYQIYDSEPYQVYLPLIGSYRTILQISGVVVMEFLELQFDSVVEFAGTVELRYNHAVFDNIMIPKPIPRTTVVDGIETIYYSTRMVRRLNISKPDVEVSHIANGMHGTYNDPLLTVTLLHRPVMPGPYMWRKINTMGLPEETPLELHNSVVSLPSVVQMTWSYTLISGMVTAHRLPELVNKLIMKVGSTTWCLEKHRARMI